MSRWDIGGDITVIEAVFDKIVATAQRLHTAGFRPVRQMITCPVELEYGCKDFASGISRLLKACHLTGDVLLQLRGKHAVDIADLCLHSRSSQSKSDIARILLRGALCHGSQIHPAH